MHKATTHARSSAGASKTSGKRICETAHTHHAGTERMAIPIDRLLASIETLDGWG
jgi:hypothetical protein